MKMFENAKINWKIYEENACIQEFIVIKYKRWKIFVIFKVWPLHASPLAEEAFAVVSII